MENLTHVRSERASLELSSSEAAYIVLELYYKIYQSIAQCIRENYKKLPKEHTRKITFLIGPTAAGKTTAQLFLRGDTMKLKSRISITF